MQLTKDLGEMAWFTSYEGKAQPVGMRERSEKPERRGSATRVRLRPHDLDTSFDWTGPGRPAARHVQILDAKAVFDSLACRKPE